MIFFQISSSFALERPARRVLIAPDLQAFITGEEQPAGELREAMYQGFASYIRASSKYFTLIDAPSLEAQIAARPLHEGTLQLAHQWRQMGLESYKRLQTKEAIDHFEKALENYETVHYEMLAPGELAEMLLYLSLSYLEEGSNVVRPLELMKKMIALDPENVLRPGYYPEYIVHFFENARNSLLQELLEAGPKPDTARRLADLVDADYVLYGFAIGSASGPPRLVTYLYSTEEGAFLDSEIQLIDILSPDSLKEATNRLMSRYSACLFEPEPEASQPVAASRGDGPLAIQIQGAYASFLRFPPPIERSFGNYGISVGASYLLTREFGLTGSLQILNSIRDYNGILRDDFTTIRLFTGAQLAWPAGPVTFGIGTSFDLTSVGPIRAFGDKNCIPDGDFLCPGDRGTVILDQHGILLGINTRARLSYRLTRSLEAVLSTSVSYFFYPLTDRILNFPLATEFGVQYRF
ncbi:MAG: hypothetical protein ACNA8W_15750 [Bradymonadaceae bacterium]